MDASIVSRRAFLPILVFVMLTLLSLATSPPASVRAAMVTATLLPGRLAITDADAATTYTATDDGASFAASFRIGIVDATGSKAGWRVQAAIGPLIGADGMPFAVRDARITDVVVTPGTGRPPVSATAYPRAFLMDGDTIFSAAPGSGMGKSSLTVYTSFAAPEIFSGSVYTVALALDLISGP